MFWYGFRKYSFNTGSLIVLVLSLAHHKHGDHFCTYLYTRTRVDYSQHQDVCDTNQSRNWIYIIESLHTYTHSYTHRYVWYASICAGSSMLGSFNNSCIPSNNCLMVMAGRQSTSTSELLYVFLKDCTVSTLHS